MNEKSISALYGDSTINLSEMIWLVLSKWRRILVWILIFSVLFCLLSILGSVNKLRNESFIAQNMATNNHLLQNYESTKTKLEARMQTLSQEINQAHDYEANSSLFAIDPYHVFFCQFVNPVPDVGKAEHGDAVNFRKAHIRGKIIHISICKKGALKNALFVPFVYSAS